MDFLRDAPLEETTGEAAGPRPRCYECAAGGLPAIRSRVEGLIAAGGGTDHGSGSGTGGAVPEHLVLFPDALEHLLRLNRVLGLERGHALLVGVGGSGKQSLTRLAAALAGAHCFRISAGKAYGVPNLLEDLRALYKQAVLKAQPVVFLVTDSDVKEEAFLEYINQVSLVVSRFVQSIMSYLNPCMVLQPSNPLLKTSVGVAPMHARLASCMRIDGVHCW